MGRLEITTESEQETIELGMAIGEVTRQSDVILLFGDLGSGKTRLAKGIVSISAGVEQGEVVSPTFTLMNRYDADPPVYHVDLYRLDPDQVYGIGMEDALDEGGILVVEWAERLGEVNEDHVKVRIEFVEAEDTRRVILAWAGNGSWEDRMRHIEVNCKGAKS